MKTKQSKTIVLNKQSVRFRLVQDDDGHWYLIQADKEEVFNTWVAAGPYWDGYEGEHFEPLGGSPSNVTFTDPKEE